MTDISDEALDGLERELEDVLGWEDFPRLTERWQKIRADIVQLRRERDEAQYRLHLHSLPPEISISEQEEIRREEEAATLARAEAAEQKTRESSAEALCQILDAESQRDAAVKALRQLTEIASRDVRAQEPSDLRAMIYDMGNVVRRALSEAAK